MPYTYSKEGSKYVVYKKNKAGQRGKKVGSTDGTKEALKKYLAALHAAENTNEGLMNVASKIERFLKPKDKNTKFKEDLQDLYYSDRTKYNELKQYYMDQVESGRQSVDIEMVLKAFDEIENSINENVHDMVRRGFKTWTYTHPGTGKKYTVKGKTLEDIKDYLKDKHDVEVSSVLLKDLSNQSGLGDANKVIRAIYNKNYSPMNEMKDKLRKIVKELMAADMPPTEKVSAMPGQDIKDEMISAVSATNDPNILRQLSTVFGGAGFEGSDNLGEMKRKLVPLMSKAGAGQYLKLSQKFAVENGEIVLKSGKEDVMYSNVKENKMKLNQLKQIIREEIGNVLGASQGPKISLRYGGGVFRDDEGSPELAQELFDLSGAGNNRDKKQLSISEFMSIVEELPMSSMFREWMNKYVGELEGDDFIEVSSSAIGPYKTVTLRTSKGIESARNVAKGEEDYMKRTRSNYTGD